MGEKPHKDWKYRTWQELNGYPYWGQMATYSGGGYVAKLGRTLAEARDNLANLKENGYVRCMFASHKELEE